MFGLGLLMVGMVSAASEAALIDMNQTVMPKSFLSGKDWRGLSKGEQQAYAVGVIDGLDLAFAYARQGADLKWVNACAAGMSSDQARAMLEAELAANPAAWNELTVHQAMYRALKHACRSKTGQIQ
jgi:hypothetical protein